MANHNGYHLIHQNILENIYAKKKELENLARDGAHFISRKHKSYHQTASEHSVEIELVGETKPTKRKERRRFLKNLQVALEWGRKNYPLVLTEQFIQDIAGKVEPLYHGAYRTGRVHLRTKNGTYFPPSGPKIDGEMGYFIFENSCIDEPVEKAIHAHFHIARIHPFSDGNGRTARLTQNIMLEKRGFFPIVVNSNERSRYIESLGSAVEVYRDARTALEIDSNPAYQELIHLLNSKTISIEGLYRCKALALHMLKNTTDRNKDNFFNYMAGNIGNAFNTELARMRSQNS